MMIDLPQQNCIFKIFSGCAAKLQYQMAMLELSQLTWKHSSVCRNNFSTRNIQDNIKKHEKAHQIFNLLDTNFLSF